MERGLDLASIIWYYPFHIIVQISPSLLKNYSFCEDRYKITLYWQSFLFLYEGLLLLMLLYLSYKNSTIKQALFMEEGQSGARMVLAITVVSLLMLIVLIFLEEKVEKYLYEYWCLLLYTTQSPMFFCAVLFIPKVSNMIVCLHDMYIQVHAHILDLYWECTCTCPVLPQSFLVYPWIPRNHLGVFLVRITDDTSWIPGIRTSDWDILSLG